MSKMILLTLNKDIVKELIEHKLRNVKKIISNLLPRWNEASAETFLKKAKDGTYPEQKMMLLT